MMGSVGKESQLNHHQSYPHNLLGSPRLWSRFTSGGYDLSLGIQLMPYSPRIKVHMLLHPFNPRSGSVFMGYCLSYGHSLLSHLATLTGRRERVWRRNRETDGTVKWDEREGIVRIGLRLHHSFCLSESNPYNPFSFHSSPWAPLVMLPRFSRGA